MPLIDEYISMWRIEPVWRLRDPEGLRGSVLRLIALAHREQLDLALLVDNLASEHRWFHRWRLRRFAKRLASGKSWIDALEQTPGLVNDSDLLSLRFAIQTGALNTILPRLVADDGEVISQMRHSFLRQLPGYLAFMALYLAVLFLIIGSIAPTWEKLLQEMEMESKAGDAPTNLFRLWASSTGMTVLLVVFFLAIIVWWMRPIRIPGYRFASYLSQDVTEWRIATVLRLFAVAIEAGRPLPGAMATLARYHYDPRLRSRLLFARNEVELGAPVWHGLTMGQMITHQEAHALTELADSGHQPWLLRRMALRREESIRRKLSLTSAIVHPLVILAMSGFVLWAAVAILGPLFQLANKISS